MVRYRLGRIADAEADCRASYQEVSALLKAAPNDVQAKRAVIDSGLRLINHDVRKGNLGNSETLALGLLRLAEQLFASDESNHGHRWRLAATLQRVGDVELLKGHSDLAQKHFHRALELQESLSVKAPTAARHRDRLVGLLERIGDGFVASPYAVQALPRYDEALRQIRQQEQIESGWFELSLLQARNLRKRATVFVQLGKQAQAQTDYQLAAQILEKLEVHDPADNAVQIELATMKRSVASDAKTPPPASAGRDRSPTAQHPQAVARQSVMDTDRPIDSADVGETTVSSAPSGHITAAPRSYFLVVRSATSSLFPLPDVGQLLAGRSPEADLRVLDQSASRLHAKFVVDRKAVRVRDLGSRNRTWVNGKPLADGEDRLLCSGDVVGIGTLTLVLHLAGSPIPVEPRNQDDVAPVLVDVGEQTTLLSDPATVRVYELIRRLSRSTLPVLIIGETGTGKENAAQAVHYFSTRKAAPMLAINCAAIPENLFESELFGHVRGAFSGALTDKVGRLEAASGGTVFLDEIGELPLLSQAKLLRALETGMVSPVGSVKERRIDCRVVAATN